MKKRRAVVSILIVLLLIGGGLYAFKNTLFSRGVFVQTLYPEDKEMWQNIFKNGESAYDFKEKPFGVVIPHHMAVSYDLAKFYNGLSKVANPSIVVVIGPNHYEAGNSNILTCSNCVFETIEGDLNVDKNTVKGLKEIASDTPDAFLQEHSIFSHSTFIKNYFPEANILPIILKWETPPEEALKLSEWLDKNLPPDALIIASIDFSHYQRANVADFHDLSSATSIRNFDFTNLYDLEIDSPASLYTLMDLMQKEGYGKTELLANTNSQDFHTDPQESTTSHEFWAFFEGEKQTEKAVSVLSFGNISENDELALNSGWKWDRNYEESKDMSILKSLKDIKGTEDRFLTGSDFNVFDLIDGQCEMKNQNGMNISFCKFSENNDYEEDPFDTIKLQKEKADIVYLLYKFGGGELTKERKKIAKDFLKNGTDIFVGRGLDGIFPFETYKGKLMIYSLGDFVKSNSLLNELESNSVGLILGIYATEDKFRVYCFPINVKNGFPKLISFSESKKAFMEFIAEESKNTFDPEKTFIEIER